MCCRACVVPCCCAVAGGHWPKRGPSASLPRITAAAALPCTCSYMYLGIALSQLGDVENARSAYEKAIQLAGESGEPAFHLNYGARVMQAGCLVLRARGVRTSAAPTHSRLPPYPCDAAAAIMLVKVGLRNDAVPQFLQFRALMESPENSKNLDPELVVQADTLAGVLGM